jgi:hypothetical protein
MTIIVKFLIEKIKKYIAGLLSRRKKNDFLLLSDDDDEGKRAVPTFVNLSYVVFFIRTIAASTS